MEQFRYRNRQIATLTHSLSLKGGKGNTRTVFHELAILHHCINLSVWKIFMVLHHSCSPLQLLSREEQALLDASRAVLRPFSLGRLTKCFISCLTALGMQICDAIIPRDKNTLGRAELRKAATYCYSEWLLHIIQRAPLELGEMTVLAIIRAWIFAPPQDCYWSTSH